jgi:hypothetical protein
LATDQDTARLNELEEYEREVRFAGDEPNPWRVSADYVNGRIVWCEGPNLRAAIDAVKAYWDAKAEEPVHAGATP